MFKYFNLNYDLLSIKLLVVVWNRQDYSLYDMHIENDVLRKIKQRTITCSDTVASTEK